MDCTLMLHTLAGTITGWDRSAFLEINHHATVHWLDAPMLAVTDLGLGQVQAFSVVALALLLAVRAGETARGGAWRALTGAVYRRRWWVGPLLVCLALSASSDVVKAVTPRLRPWWFYEQEHVAGRQLGVHVRTVPGVYPLKVRGFPSGHTTSTVALATVATMLILGRRRRRGLAWLVPALWALAGVVAFSRIYLASHWPLDVLAGALLGALCGLLSLPLCKAWARKRARPVRAARHAAGGRPGA